VTTPHIQCAGGIVFDTVGSVRRLLLIRRANPPSAGTWSVPGGKCWRGEPPEQACVREVAEETGLDVRVLHYAGRVERDGPDGVVFDIDDYVCEVVGGTLRAGDDAIDAGWFSLTDLDALVLASGLLEALSGWNELPS
jgi:8-oxo-dGTP diphosphatase